MPFPLLPRCGRVVCIHDHRNRDHDHDDDAAAFQFFEGSKSAKIELDEAEVAQLPTLRRAPPTADGSANPVLDEKTAKTRKALIEKLALAQEVQRLVMEKRIRPLLVTEVRAII